MRIPIREQLGLLVLLVSLIALMVLALAVWFQSHDFIIGVGLSALTLTASLKAAELASILLLYQSQVQAISTRVLVQEALTVWNNGNHTPEAVQGITPDLQGALTSFGASFLLMQAIIFPNNDEVPGAIHGIVNVTGDGFVDKVKLPYPYTRPDGSPAYLGDPGAGYPGALYPNFTFVHGSDNETQAYLGETKLNYDTTLFIGPLNTNDTYSLFSVTMAINNNTSRTEILGWITVVLNADMLYNIISAPEGLGNSGEILVIGPADTKHNKYRTEIRGDSAQDDDDRPAKFVFPPQSNSSLDNRHSLRSWQSGNSTMTFNMSDYPAVVDAWSSTNHAINNAGALISTHNEQGVKVSVGYAILPNELVDWAVVIEQSTSVTQSPISHLRNIVLACVFGTTGAIVLLTFPLAHYFVRPIQQLRMATKKTVEPYVPDSLGRNSGSSTNDDEPEGGEGSIEDQAVARKEGFIAAVSRWKDGLYRIPTSKPRISQSRTFRIPGKVPERKHWIHDELTDLTRTFNEMSEELVMQYDRLEERVQIRTAELEKSKKAAEVANESKTLFIANISHELKTPLNGILGLCAVCMQEDDIRKIRSTLGTIYKSGDLLLHLLTDLLTFSKNSIGQQIQIDESEFRLIDLKTQVVSIFEKQARESQVDLKVTFSGTSDAYGNPSENIEDRIYGPSGTGCVRDMCLWGDKNRILQVLMNFTSNSLKFTPAHGSVEVRIRCTGVAEDSGNLAVHPRNPSLQSKHSRNSNSGGRRDRGSNRGSKRNSDTSLDLQRTPPLGSDGSGRDPMLNINIAGTTKQIPQLAVRRRSTSPPPLNTKFLCFEFEVEDTGPGIPEDQQRRIFEPFVQGDLGLSKKYGGTGLGLSICAQLANLMGGSITLKSMVGVGSTFAMTIPLRYVHERAASIASSNARVQSTASSIVGQPLHDAPRTPRRRLSSEDLPSHFSNDGHEDHEPSLVDVPRIVGFTQPYVAKEQISVQSSKNDLQELKKAENKAAKTGKKVRVLVAEDNKVNQEVVLRMLRLEDVYDVILARDGQEALDIVRETMAKGERFDLVFMDIQMPNLDGIQSTKLIREMGFSAPIVALTAFAEESNMKECMESGMNFFLPKPIRRPALKHVLKKFTTIPEEDGDGATANKLEGEDSATDCPTTNGAVIDSRPGRPDDFAFSKPKTTVHTIQDSELDSNAVSPMS